MLLALVFFLLAAHALMDYSLQSETMAGCKCRGCDNPVANEPAIAIGPSHFVSKPRDNDCLGVFGNTATTRTYVTQTSGLPFPPGGLQTPPLTGLAFGDAVNFSFVDNGNPSQWTDTVRDMLEGPPVSNIPNCPGPAVPPPGYVLQNGNINIFPR